MNWYGNGIISHFSEKGELQAGIVFLGATNKYNEKCQVSYFIGDVIMP
jgi:hypothetical protein